MPDTFPISTSQALTGEVERLRRRNAELERSSDDLQRFVFAVTHDLREPLRTIYTHAQLLETKHSESFDGEAAMYLANIIDGAARMGNVLSSLLVYASASSAPEPLEVVDLNVAVEKAKQNLRGSIAESK